MSTGCPRTVAIGIEMGGLLACWSQASGAEIDDLVLWDVPSRGRSLVRQMRALASVAADGSSDDAANDGSGALRLIGYPMSAATVSDLSALDLARLPVPGGAGHRLLLLGRDATAPDARLRQHFDTCGAVVEIGDGGDHHSLIDEPQLAETPHATVALSLARGPERRCAPSSQARCRVEAPVSAGRRARNETNVRTALRTRVRLSAAPHSALLRLLGATECIRG